MPLSFKLFGFGLLLFVVGFFMSQRSLRLKFWGKTVPAVMVDAWERSGNRGGSTLIIQYSFPNEKGEQVRGGQPVSTDWRPPVDGKMMVVYLPSDPSISQFAETSGTTGYLVFFAGIGVMALAVWYFNRESVVEAHAETEATLDRARRRSIAGRLGIDR
jgi:hypothetical protein